MTQWATFVGLTGVVCVLLLLLSHATKTTLTEPTVPEPGSNSNSNSELGSDSNADSDPRRTIDSNGRPHPNADHSTDESDSRTRTRNPDPESESAATGYGVDAADANAGASTETSSNASSADETADPTRSDSSATAGRRTAAKSELEGGTETKNGESFDSERQAGGRRAAGRDGEYVSRMESMSTGALLANVAFSQGLFAAVLIAAAFYTEIPADALGIAFTREYLVTGISLGTGVGIVLYVANEIGAATIERLGVDHTEELREVLAPDSLGGWLVLLVVVLPIIAFFEEFLFRAALIGAASVGFGIPSLGLAIVSSVAFALGHGMQGTAGIVVTGVLGFVLAGVFIYTGSLLVVVVAHYLINAFEFVVHEGLGLELIGE